MINSQQLLADLQKQVTRLENDFRARCNADPTVDEPLKADYQKAKASGRVASTYSVWRDEEITQSAVAWVLACVFIRFLEDNELIETPYLSGPGPRLQRAKDELEVFFRQHPTQTEREYFELVFGIVGTLPAMKELFDRKHNPLWRVGPTGDAARELLDFWRKTDPDTGLLLHDFTDPAWNTRFLGDLYQDLSEFARKRYALLQTPVFVEEFILDRTLTPAIETFGWRVVRMIDITCGSGHFLLGGFDRLLRLWQQNEPGENPRVLVQKALDQVYGVDLNPNVVAIARFRLLLVALHASGVRRLRDAPDFRINLATGDSLLHGSRFRGENDLLGYQQTLGGDELFKDELKHYYEVEDSRELHRILGQQYHAVVGNPPYITVKDRALNQLYRARYKSCHREYSLAVPFMERFFDLAIDAGKDIALPAGRVGMITANSFMKREFGKKLVEQFIQLWDITHVIDTDKAHIPGHATGTVIILGNHRHPASHSVRTLMGIKKQEPSPDPPSSGYVWNAILDYIDKPGSQTEWLSVTDTPIHCFYKHPWSIGGGGAAELKQYIDSGCQLTLRQFSDAAGFLGMSHADDVMVAPLLVFIRHSLEKKMFRPLIIGESVRNWCITISDAAFFPYDDKHLLDLADFTHASRFLFPYRSILRTRATFGGGTYLSEGRPWWEWHQIALQRITTPNTITFGSVATHNSFALDRGGNAFRQSAPILKLKVDATVDEYTAILGLLNSSLACFWMKQVFYDKGGGGIGGGISAELWEHRYDHDSTKLATFPVPVKKPDAVSAEAELLAQEIVSHSPATLMANNPLPTDASIELAKQSQSAALSRIVSAQEELDWECYHLYGLTPNRLFFHPGQIPPIQLGERAFEIVMARKMAAGELQTTWFARHGSTPVTEIPTHWPAAYRDMVERRIALIESDRNIALIEQPEYKRRWNMEPWDQQLERALREWLLNRLEGYFFEGRRVCEIKDGFDPTKNFVAATGPHLVSANQLAEAAQADKAFLQVAELYIGASGFSVPKLIRQLVEDESVPNLPVHRYKESGLRNLKDWEHVWDLQRMEDAVEAEVRREHDAIGGHKSAVVEEGLKKTIRDAQGQQVGEIPVPPKYAGKDFKKMTYWKLRGKLDVPKERWIIYAGAERDGDSSPMIAWAGWNHLHQAKALAEYYLDAKQNQGWPPNKLKVLLAGLLDLLPWLKQWHNQIDPDLGMGLGDYFAGFLEDECRLLAFSKDDLELARWSTEAGA